MPNYLQMNHQAKQLLLKKATKKVVKKPVVESDSSSEEDVQMLKKKTKAPTKMTKKPVVESDSDSESVEIVKKKTTPKKVVKKAPVVSDSDEESSEEVKPKKVTKTKTPPKKVKKAPVVSDSDEESSEEVVKPKKVTKTPPKKVKAPVESDSDEEESSEEVVKPKSNGNKAQAKPQEEAAEEGHNELFVRNLSYKSTEDSLWNFFSTYGTVTKVKILTNREDGRSKGIGFVEFASNAECKAALDDAANLNCDGRDIQVNYSGQKDAAPKGNSFGGNQGGYGGSQGGFGGNRGGQSSGGDKFSAFVGNLSFKATENSIRQHFSKCGGISDIRIAKDRDTGKMKGFAHVDFESNDALQNAIKMNGQQCDGRELKVDASTPKAGGSGGRGGFGGGRGGRGGGRGSFDPMMKAQKSGAIINTGTNNVVTFDD